MATIPNKLPQGLTLDMVVDACEDDDYMGFCLACAEEAYSVEPDARAYECESCGENKVYGAEEIVLMFVA